MIVSKQILETGGGAAGAGCLKGARDAMRRFPRRSREGILQERCAEGCFLADVDRLISRR